MTLPEAALLLGLSPDGLRVQANRGRLRATKRGRDWFVTPHEVERYRRESLGHPGRPPKKAARKKRATTA